MVMLLLSDRYPQPRPADGACAARHRRGAPPPGRAPACAATCNLIVETGTARDPHHFACLIGFGATAVYPYLAYQTLFDLGRARHPRDQARRRARADRPQLPPRHQARACSKIISKMGISTIGSYRGAQLFEIVGLRPRRRRAVLRRHAVAHRRRRLRASCEAEARQLAARAWNDCAMPRDRRPAASTCTAANTTCTTRTW